MERFPARQRALASLILVDIGLKACARALLRGRDSPARPFGPFHLGYVENASGFGFDQTRLLARYGVATDDAFIVCTLAVFLSLALIIHLWHKVAISPWKKTLASAAIYLAMAAAALAIHDSVRLSLAPYFRGLFRALGPLSIALALYVEVEKPYYSFLSLLLLAGTLGNSLSLLLPPFAVVDYLGIYRPSIGGYVYANAADAYLAAGMALILFIPFYLIARRLHESA
jgi:lipoprotein signal peptidase